MWSQAKLECSKIEAKAPAVPAGSCSCRAFAQAPYHGFRGQENTLRGSSLFLDLACVQVHLFKSEEASCELGWVKCGTNASGSAGDVLSSGCLAVGFRLGFGSA